MTGRDASRITAALACALVVFLAASQLGAMSYEFDSQERLTAVVYDDGTMLRYQYDEAGNIVRRTVHGLLALGVLPNPQLDRYLDLYLVSGRALDPDSVALRVDGDPVELQCIGEELAEELWGARYAIEGAGGELEIAACARSLDGVRACVASGLTARRVEAAAGGVIGSPDGRLSLRIPPGGLAVDGSVYVLPLSGRSAAMSPEEGHDGLALLCRMDAGQARPTYRLTATAPLLGEATIELDYGSLDLPSSMSAERLYIERPGSGPLACHVDPVAQVIRATTPELGDFRLAIAETPTTPIADPRYLAVSAGAPNPLRDRTRIRFDIQTPQHVVVDLFDVGGRRVVRLLDGMASAGTNLITWDGRNASRAPVASGVYFARIETETAEAVTRLVVIR